MGWHTLSSEKVIKKLESSPKGLSEEAAEKRLEEYGPNKITVEKGVSPLTIFVNQFKNLLVIILIIAATISLALSYFEPGEAEAIDAYLIFGIVIANAIFGFVQEYKAEKTIEELTKMSAPMATVLRNGKEKEINSEKVVPGDIILLDEGDKVPADAKLIESFSLQVDESALTGESFPAEKRPGVLEKDIPLAERSNMVFMNTVVTRGHGKAVAVETALNTEVGKIAKEISEAPQKKTRFQFEIEDVGKKISVITLGILIVIAATNIILGSGDLIFIFLAAVALGVAAIPEGLPAVVTLALSMATNRMLEQNALMRRLSTIQDLGSVDVICTDKTGTLTENTMTVRKIYFEGKYMSVGGKGLEKNGEIVCEKGKCPARLELLLKAAVLCNDAHEIEEEKGKRFKGDPTEVALLLPAYKAGYDVEKIRGKMKRLNENPFSSDRKMMSTLNKGEENNFVFVKGAPEVVVSRCNRILDDGKPKKLTSVERKEIEEKNKEMASEAFRVIGLAYKENGKREYDEENLVFLGLMGMIDPPREGVKQAVEDCRNAGIRVIMITGDNKYTAEAIGSELGFPGEAVTGDELDRLPEEKLSEVIENSDIYARTSPHHKVMILKTLKNSGHAVCMTGDGVNDAAAIKNSDVGIAMGVRGTEVTKQASDIIILDDNFISIRNAVAEGRGTFDNIRKFVTYLLGANISEVLVVFLATVTSLGISPKIPIQLLWINLLTDGLPALALGVDAPAKNIMERKPREKSERMIDKDTMYFLVSLGVSAAIAIISLYAWSLSIGQIKGYTMLFAGFVVLEMLTVYLVRWRYKTNLFSNGWLHLAVFTSLALQVVVIYTPLNSLFLIEPLALQDWLMIGAAQIVYLVLVGIALRIEHYFIKEE
ncbi:calcium-translocating P-type ATPase, PMCA-type [Candidatus Micrarchaeota archaeon]|nr:calcium-translocating P-type ATPase, PMCA-type [Candidatus Micrarchaeota archaeon]